MHALDSDDYTDPTARQLLMDAFYVQKMANEIQELKAANLKLEQERNRLWDKCRELERQAALHGQA